MKRRVVLLAALAVLSLFAAHAVQTSSITLTWTPSPSPNIAGYEIYYGTSSSNCTSTMSVSNVTSVVVNGLTNGMTYYFMARASNTLSSLSACSPQISWVVVIPAKLTVQGASSPGHFGITVSGVTGSPYVVEASTNLVNWVMLETNAAPFNFVDTNTATFSRRFYRAVYLEN